MDAVVDRIRVLVVDDDSVDRQAICRALAKSALEATCEQAADAAEGLRMAQTGAYDCLLLDHDLPTRTGIDLARDLRAAGNRTPILLVTGRQDDELEQLAADAGITDYVPKTDVSTPRLARRIRFAIRIGQAEADSARSLAAATLATHARNDVLAVVSHDLRGPLHAISLACEALREEVSPTAGRYLGAIERASARAERLIADLLEASVIERGGLTLSVYPTDAASLLKQAAVDGELPARDSGGPISLRLPDGPVQVRADRDRVMQVFANLIGNALKHARGTPIELSLERRTTDAVFAVTDRGPGINATELPHVFDRYWQGRTKKAGAGLGLAIAKGIVVAHGGTIEVVSTPGQGASFRFTLPLAS